MGKYLFRRKSEGNVFPVVVISMSGWVAMAIFASLGIGFVLSVIFRGLEITDKKLWIELIVVFGLGVLWLFFVKNTTMPILRNEERNNAKH